MRATTLTSMTVLALLWQGQLCAAQGKPPESVAQTSSKSEAGPLQKGVGRFGSLSPDETRRAARARARAAAALKKADPVRAAASAPAKVPEQTKTTEQTKTPAETKTPQQAKSAETVKLPVHDVAASKPVAQAEQVAAKPPQDDSGAAATTGRSASVDVKGGEARSTKQAVRTTERDRKRKARREARHIRDRNDGSRARSRFAGEPDRAPRVGDTIPPGVPLAPVPQRYWRVGRGGGPRVIVADGPGQGYAERVIVAPRGYMPGPAYVSGYPPYPGTYVDDGE